MGEIILAVGAHPDDFELGCGGTLLKHCLEGQPVYGLILTKGQNGNHSPDLSEALASLRRFGLKESRILDFPDGELVDSLPYVSRLEEEIRRIGPSRVYTHTGNDRHQDHRNCSRLVQSAARFIPQVLLFESPSTTTDFSPTYFSNISHTLEQKLATLRMYESQVDKGTIDIDFVRAQALYWGFRSKAKNGVTVYAEAFEVARFISD